MTNLEFEEFVLQNGNDILSFCKMQTMSTEIGNELYQDTMLKLLEKKKGLDLSKNVKSYAISVAILLWKNKKKTYIQHSQKAEMNSLEGMLENGDGVINDENTLTPEQEILKNDEATTVRKMVNELPDKLRIPIILYYSSNMKISEISEATGESENTIKTRMRRAKAVIKEKLEELGYDR